MRLLKFMNWNFKITGFLTTHHAFAERKNVELAVHSFWAAVRVEF